MNIRQLIAALEQIIATDPNVSLETDVEIFAEAKDETGQFVGIRGDVCGMGFNEDKDCLSLICGEMPDHSKNLDVGD